MGRISIVLIKLFILHEHNSDSKIEKEEGADNDASNEVNGDEPIV